ncbi:glycosyltransferase [Marinobacter litoralis]|nr:glycosyltransferase [Marinobacter litoralis]
MQGLFNWLDEMKIRVVYAGSGRGLQKDAEILSMALTQLGHKCELCCVPPTPPWRNKLSRLRGLAFERTLPKAVASRYYLCRRWLMVRLSRSARDINLVIHLENVRPSELHLNATHWLIPNQEWFIESRLPYLRFIDQILCKTHQAVEIFSSKHSNSRYLGFTGSICPDNPEPLHKDYELALHVAGNSQFKGTDALVNCWKDHPEWPKLVVVSQHLQGVSALSTNIQHHQSLPEKDLTVLWEKAGLAIIPSEVEGYGQVLAEAMAHGCVTITTDAPPMNEVIHRKRGFLITPLRNEPFRLGTRYFVSQTAIEKAMAEVLNVNEHTLKELSTASITWYRSNHSEFIQRLQAYLNQITRQPPG